jgi:hypothetical protein
VEKLGYLDSFALGVLQSAPFWVKSGRLVQWSIKRLQVVFDRLAEEAFLATVENCSQNPTFKGKNVTVTLYEVMKNGQIMVDGVAEWGLSFSGSCAGLFSRFRFQREVGIL